MTARRRNASTTLSSLDLFLDTACNAFGGIMFMAILLTIMAQLRSSQPPARDARPPLDPHEMARLEERAAALEAEQVQLENAIDQLRPHAQIDANPAAQQLKTQIDQLRETCQRTDAEQRDALDQLTAQIRENETMRDSLPEVPQQLQTAEAELDALTVKYEQVIRSREQRVRLPKVRISQKSNVLTMLRYGRLYVIHRVAPDGARTIDTSAVKVVVNGPQTSIAPIPGAGWSVEDPGQRQAIETWLRTGDPQVHSITVAVFGDSFESFATLKELLIERGFEYELIPFVDVDFVPLGTGIGQSQVQ